MSDSTLVQLPSLINQRKLPGEVPYNSEGEANETVYLCYSSGTTGMPKGVEVCYIWAFSCCICVVTSEEWMVVYLFLRSIESFPEQTLAAYPVYF
jgi:long-subunit acyl-CoA synthetase (AMP-forming)